MASIRPTWTLTVPSDRCSLGGDLAVGPARRRAGRRRLCSRSVSLLSRASRSCCRPGSGSSGTNWSMSRRVAVGARTASPPATVRMAVSSSAGGASLSRNPLAPALSPAKTYSSRSKVVRMRTLLAGPAAVIAAVACDSVHAGHPDVHQHHVGVQGRCHADAGRPVGGLADHLDVRLGLEDHPEAHAEQGLVIDEQDPDHAASPPSRCSRAETFQPPGWRGPACTSPP